MQFSVVFYVSHGLCSSNCSWCVLSWERGAHAQQQIVYFSCFVVVFFLLRYCFFLLSFVCVCVCIIDKWLELWTNMPNIHNNLNWWHPSSSQDYQKLCISNCIRARTSDEPFFLWLEKRKKTFWKKTDREKHNFIEHDKNERIFSQKSENKFSFRGLLKNAGVSFFLSLSIRNRLMELLRIAQPVFPIKKFTKRFKKWTIARIIHNQRAKTSEQNL